MTDTINKETLSKPIIRSLQSESTANHAKDPTKLQFSLVTTYTEILFCIPTYTINI